MTNLNMNPSNSLRHKARMVVRTVFRGKRKHTMRPLSYQKSNTKLALKTRSNHCAINIKKISNKLNNYPKALSNDGTLMNFGSNNKLSKIYKEKKLNENHRPSLSADNLKNGDRIMYEKLLLAINEKEKLKKTIKTQNRQLEDLKHQLNSERSVYEGKIEYLNSLSDSLNSDPIERKESESISEGTQTVSSSAHDLDKQVNFSLPPLQQDNYINNDLEDLKIQLYKQTMVTKCVCAKYLKLKTYKDIIMDKLLKSENFYKLFVSEIMQNFDECRLAFALANASILDKGSIEHLLDKNARLAYNNAAMQLEMFKLERERKLVRNPTLGSYSEDDFEMIKLLKDKSEEYALARKPSTSSSSMSNTNNNTMSKYNNYFRPSTAETMSTSCTSISQSVSVTDSVISIPVSVIKEGRTFCKMIPMFEIVNNMEKDQKQLSNLNQKEITKKSNSLVYNKKFEAAT